MLGTIYSKSLVGAVSGLLIFAPPNIARAQSGNTTELYTLCALHPEAAACEKVIQNAMQQSGPDAQAVREAYESYARYLKDPSTGLTEADRRYLQDNNISVPNWLSATQMAGLHNVINDQSLVRDDQARNAAINRFIAHAVQSSLYCDFNACGGDGAKMLNS